MIERKAKKIGFLLIAACAIITMLAVRSATVERPVAQDASARARALAFTQTLAIANTAVHVAVAQTEAEREQGLSGTAPLGPNEGMLFVFDAPAIQYFWMKDMNYGLDMIWIGEDMKIKKITENALPESYPDTIFSSDVPVKYVLEVPNGFSQKNNIKIGDTVSL
jgi:uncharacterized membrane protein (UPF0127 family)